MKTTSNSNAARALARGTALSFIFSAFFTLHCGGDAASNDGGQSGSAGASASGSSSGGTGGTGGTPSGSSGGGSSFGGAGTGGTPAAGGSTPRNPCDPWPTMTVCMSYEDALNGGGQYQSSGGSTGFPGGGGEAGAPAGAGAGGEAPDFVPTTPEECPMLEPRPYWLCAGHLGGPAAFVMNGLCCWRCGLSCG